MSDEQHISASGRVTDKDSSARNPKSGYVPGLSPWLARRVLSHGETYLRRKAHLARMVQRYRANPNDGSRQSVAEATDALKRSEAKLARSLWRLRQETERDA